MHACLLKYTCQNCSNIQPGCPFSVLSRAQNESLGAEADPGHEPLCPVPVPQLLSPLSKGGP